MSSPSKVLPAPADFDEEKEKQKLIQEKCQRLLNEILRDVDNRYCVDCDAKGPLWASWNLGIFLCMRCAGIHRNLGVHISKVKSVNLDTWTPEQVVTMQEVGNSRARAIYEANVPDKFQRPQTDVAIEFFIRAKYEHKQYIAKEWVQPPPPEVDWNAEIEEQIRKKKEKKNTDAILPKLRSPNSKPSQLTYKRNRQPPATLLSSSSVGQQKPNSASEDLFGFITDTSDISPDPFLSAENFYSVAETVHDPWTPLIPTTTTADGESGTSSENDFGGDFIAHDQDLQHKLTKESILKLYGNLGSGSIFPGGGGGGMAPPPASTNPFITAVGQYGSTSMNNPFCNQPQGNINNFIGNNGLGGTGVGASVMLGGNHQMGATATNVFQLQQGHFTLNLALSPQPGQPTQQSTPQNSNRILFNYSPNPPTSNLMMTPHQLQPFVQQHTPQNPLFNQFQQTSPAIGLFHNGGSAGGRLTGCGTTMAAIGNGNTNPVNVNVDLL